MTSKEEIALLKDATREAHEVLKDLRLAIKEGRGLLVEINAAAQKDVETYIEPIIVTGIEHFKTTLDEHIEKATQGVYDRFDVIANLLMGKDKASARKGLKPLDEIARDALDGR